MDNKLQTSLSQECGALSLMKQRHPDTYSELSQHYRWILAKIDNVASVSLRVCQVKVEKGQRKKLLAREKLTCVVETCCLLPNTVTLMRKGPKRWINRGMSVCALAQHAATTQTRAHAHSPCTTKLPRLLKKAFIMCIWELLRVSSRLMIPIFTTLNFDTKDSYHKSLTNLCTT